MAFDIDQEIKNKFQLFQGKRANEEDQKIYDKVYSLCLNEMIVFTGENVSKEEMDKLSKRLDTEDPRTTFLGALENVPMAKLRLNTRLKYFIDRLLLESLKKHREKQ